MSSTVVFDSVRPTYGDVTALDDISVAFDPGFNVVLGPNGAGKTTLFRIGAGILPPDAGGVTVAGIDPFADQSVKTRVGYLPHGTPLNGQLTVSENLDYWGRVLGLDTRTRDARIEQTAKTMAVDDLLDRPATDLSRGQRQRVTIARVLLGDPAVLFLDEPTTGLDPGAARSLRDQLDALAAEGRTLCYSTHNLYEAEQLADELTVIKDGTVAAQGPKDELIGRLRGEGAREVYLESDADNGTFAALGIEARESRDGWVVTLPEDQSVNDLITVLIERGFTIERVQEEETSLEELYGRLTGEEEVSSR
ncbi:ATP-binding cassette domain-containing protein [Haloferax sp. MBLA0076]|uniref:ATP-binding cassette domain-containing protein n=1 Tax=Haloferax litoreum TaxID=2666140 RepID=A0A6A8GJK6_9EURY|nr:MULTISPECIES: ABC transporter ATP-binding protein [Haloferax]KAB1190463.1 ABC transporter ATP-binding protein [Haloferax sp. CBA1148]MRX23438.1 ATP-binding cassette domain-containing protein [Haloferax litoreum]